MSDKVFETRGLDDLFRAYAEQGVRPIDRYAIAEATVALGRPSMWRVLSFRRVGRVFLVAATVAALAAAALWIIGHRAPAPPSLRVYRDEFVSAGTLTTPRSNSVVVTLRDGRVFILGGDNSETRTAEVFDPVTGTSVATPPLPDGGDYFNGALLADGSVLVFGFSLATGRDVAVGPQRFYPESLRFESVGKPVIPRLGAHLTTLADGRVLMTGGGTGGDIDATQVLRAEVFDPSTGEFSLSGSAPAARLRGGGLLLPDGRVLFVALTGVPPDRLPSLDDTMVLETYDPATGSFRDVAITQGPGGIPVLLRDGRVLISGGSGGMANVRATSIWDGANIIAASAPPTAPLTAAVLDDGRVFITANRMGSAFWAGLYDPQSDRWTEAPGVAAFRPAVTKLLDGRLLLVGGREDGEIHDMELGGRSAPAVATLEYFQ